jgi:serine/threonine protein kinase
VCGEDEGLLHELVSLLSYRNGAEDFLESPPLALAIQLIPGYQPASGSMIGREVSHYRIIEELGAGGMGVVYKAQDTTLGRFVALKFFHPAFGSNLELIEHEARASSALDHPNICTVYEVNRHEGTPFIAMQFLAGDTQACSRRKAASSEADYRSRRSNRGCFECGALGRYCAS